MDDDEPKTERIQIVMGPSLRVAIRKWRHANEVGSESEAIRRLIQRGLDAEAADRAKPPRKG